MTRLTRRHFSTMTAATLAGVGLAPRAAWADTPAVSTSGVPKDISAKSTKKYSIGFCRKFPD